MPFDADSLPRRDLGLEGTPWYMAPEVLSSTVTPASDLWSAGVMAYQLLSGRLPFNDRRSPSSPSITVIWCASWHSALGVGAPCVLRPVLVLFCAVLRRWQSHLSLDRIFSTWLKPTY